MYGQSITLVYILLIYNSIPNCKYPFLLSSITSRCFFLFVFRIWWRPKILFWIALDGFSNFVINPIECVHASVCICFSLLSPICIAKRRSDHGISPTTHGKDYTLLNSMVIKQQNAQQEITQIEYQKPPHIYCYLGVRFYGHYAHCFLVFFIIFRNSG